MNFTTKLLNLWIQQLRCQFGFPVQSICLIALILFAGCGYPDVSEQTYELAKALFSACNRHSEEHLTSIENMIDASLADDEISSREATWLREIIQTAQAGEWEEATGEARKLMVDQIEYK